MKETQEMPDHWGSAPTVQTGDIRELPCGYGWGSSTMVGWIKKKMIEDGRKDELDQWEADHE